MKIYSLIPKIMGEVGAITKDRTNDFQKYKFRGIEDIYVAFHPVLVKYGVFCAPQVLRVTSSEHQNDKGKTAFRVLLEINHKFYADDGSFVEVITCGEGVDSGDKASNKAMSAAFKYAFIELFCNPTEDVDDSDRESPTVQPAGAPGVLCESCHAPLRVTRDGKGYFCPNFSQPVAHGAVSHTKFPLSELDAYKKYCKENFAGFK